MWKLITTTPPPREGMVKPPASELMLGVADAPEEAMRLLAEGTDADRGEGFSTVG